MIAALVFAGVSILLALSAFAALLPIAVEQQRRARDTNHRDGSERP